MKRYVTMSQFGRWGRAGNQFFQYAFLRSYARQHNLELQLPPWVGNHLFGAADPPITVELPVYTEPGRGLMHAHPPNSTELVGRDYRGFAQYHTSYYAAERNRLKSLYHPAPQMLTRLSPAARQLRTSGSTIIGIHLRRGDYGQSIFPIIPTDWYLRWLRENVHRFQAPVLFIATEDTSLVEDFNQYYTQTTETLGIDLVSQPMADCTYLEHDLQTKDQRAMDWYPDFYLLSQCDVILAPNSTFSFFAAMLAPCLREFWRASLRLADFEQVDPWDAYPILREAVRDYAHLPGVQLASNPYW